MESQDFREICSRRLKRIAFGAISYIIEAVDNPKRRQEYGYLSGSRYAE